LAESIEGSLNNSAVTGGYSFSDEIDRVWSYNQASIAKLAGIHSSTVKTIGKVWIIP